MKESTKWFLFLVGWTVLAIAYFTLSHSIDKERRAEHEETRQFVQEIHTVMKILCVPKKVK